jgi:hypothetical protein
VLGKSIKQTLLPIMHHPSAAAASVSSLRRGYKRSGSAMLHHPDATLPPMPPVRPSSLKTGNKSSVNTEPPQHQQVQKSKCRYWIPGDVLNSVEELFGKSRDQPMEITWTCACSTFQAAFWIGDIKTRQLNSQQVVQNESSSNKWRYHTANKKQPCALVHIAHTHKLALSQTKSDDESDYFRHFK